MRVKFRVGPGVRCDLVAYAGKNLNGKRQQVQFFPTGAQRGSLDGSEVTSMVIRALPNTRVRIQASDGDDWEKAAWRVVRVLPGSSLPSQRRNGLPGVRLPEIDLLDEYSAKKTATDLESSYPYVESIEKGNGWTFGRGGGLRNRVAMIVIEREGEQGRVPTPAESVAMAVIDALKTSHPEAVPVAVEAAVASLGEVLQERDADERIAELQEWAGE